MAQQINIGGVWKTASSMQINIGGVWKTVSGAWINVGGVWKDVFSAGTDTAAPSVPLNIFGYESSAWVVTLDWSASYDLNGVAGYEIYRGTSAGGTYTLQGTSAVNSFTQSVLNIAITFYYKVLAYDAAGNKSGLSGASNAVNVSGLV